MCDFIDWLGTPVYDNPDNPILQSIKFVGRAQLQYAYIDGEGTDGADFSADFEEIRRLRLGTEINLLKYFTVFANANLEEDNTPSGGDRDIRYASLDDATVTFNAKEAFGAAGLDELNFIYGRRKVSVGYEVHTSSKRIKTVERSAIANNVYPERMTGFVVQAGKGNVSGELGIYSTESSREVAGWDAGTAIHGSVTVKVGDGQKIVVDGLYNDANGDPFDNEVADNNSRGLAEWALSAAWVATGDRWELLVNGFLADNGTQGSPEREGQFHGLVIMPSYEIVEDRLEGVVRYAYQGADENEGIRAYSRYFRRDHDGMVNSGRGDEHHSIYAGLNYFLCGHNAKVMAGVELQSLDTPGVGDGDADAVTYWLAFRTYF
ncbi:MAG: hypothetical protein HKN82_07295 [Akkermansiaceae bacterium]|nr:hypothetical protein [Akkermansiaceae bacterium]